MAEYTSEGQTKFYRQLEFITCTVGDTTQNKF
jgi:hypothetical protein